MGTGEEDEVHGTFLRLGQTMKYLAALTFEIAICWLKICRHSPSLLPDNAIIVNDTSTTVAAVIPHNGPRVDRINAAASVLYVIRH